MTSPLYIFSYLKALLQAAQLVDSRIVAGLLQAAKLHLRAGAAQQGNGLIETTRQRQTFRTRGQLLIAVTQLPWAWASSSQPFWSSLLLKV
jgi:hypothetical protein